MEWISTNSGVGIPMNKLLLLGWRSSRVFHLDDSIDFGLWNGKNFHARGNEQPYAQPDFWAEIEELPDKAVE